MSGQAHVRRLIAALALTCMATPITAAPPQARQFLLGENGPFRAILKVDDDLPVTAPGWMQILVDNPSNRGAVTEWWFEFSNATISPEAPGRNAGLQDLKPTIRTSSASGIPFGLAVLPHGLNPLRSNTAAMAAAALNLPAAGTWRVRADATFTLFFYTGHEVALAGQPVPIEFIWRGRGQEVEAESKWLTEYLARASLSFRDGLGAMAANSDFQRAVVLLKNPAIIAGFDPRTLCSAIFRQPSSQYRDILVGIVDEIWSGDPRVIAAYRQALSDGDASAVTDLHARHGRHLWRAEFVDLLVRLAEVGVKPPFPPYPPDVSVGALTRDETFMVQHALDLLDRHYADWADRRGVIAARLFRALDRPLASLEGDWWPNQVRLLAFARDAAAVSVLRPYLNDRTTVFDASLESSGQFASWRRCDLAHDAILRILGERGEYGTLTGDVRRANYRGSFTQFWPEWDRQNAALDKRLAGR